jgi:hypothetical protein
MNNGPLQNRNRGQKKVVMARGLTKNGIVRSTVNIYSVTEDTWRTGMSTLMENIIGSLIYTYHIITANPLPHAIYGAAVVPLGDTFLLVGGSINGHLLKTICKYNVSNDSWDLLSVEMKRGN